MSKTITQAIAPRMLHLPRLLFFTLTLVFAFALPASGSFEGQTRAETSPALTNSSTKNERSQTAESRWTTLDGARIHYVNYGKGSEALVLIHGWTCNLDNWRDQFSVFAKRNRVIEIDLAGHGQSDKPQITYSMDLFARAVEAVMRDAKVKRAVLVGHSMGTPIARQFYRKYPEKTLAIVIVDGPLRPFGDKALMDRLIAGFRGPNYQQALSQMFAGMAGPDLSAEAQQRNPASYPNTPHHLIFRALDGIAHPS